jgi:serine-type D-Ala-D-Ala carboxypeptidase/endopeptidase (penicillin-binding protein 4)
MITRVLAVVLLLLTGVGAPIAPIVTIATPELGLRQRERTAAAPVATPQATPSPSPSPSPEPTPAQARVATTTRSLAELQSKIVEILQKPELAPALIGVKVASLDNGRVLFEENAQKLVRPASNMKLYTVATALDRLTPDYHFITSIYGSTKPTSDGVLRGDLTVYGRGDPSLAARFNSGDYFKSIEDLATRIAGTGLKKVEGDLIGDESYFSGAPYGSGWDWDDLTWYYGAEVSSLTVNDNALDLFVKPASESGKPAIVTTGPVDPLLTIVNRVATVAKGTRRSISISRALGSNTVELAGWIPVDDRGYTGGIGISRPAQLYLNMLRTALVKRGIKVTGKDRVTSEKSASLVPRSSPSAGPPLPPYEIVSFPSPPFAVIAAQTLKPSQNLYTELILRTLGEVLMPAATTPVSSEDAGHEVVKSFLKEAGLKPDSLVLSDGSGLSRNDMVTAEATVQLLTYMSKHKYAAFWRDALPIAGVDGTLRNRMKNTAAENNLRAKTGSLSSVASLSGYVTSAAGENLVFSIIVNNYPRGVEPRTACIDPIALLLASFAGRSE